MANWETFDVAQKRPEPGFDDPDMDNMVDEEGGSGVSRPQGPRLSPSELFTLSKSTAKTTRKPSEHGDVNLRTNKTVTKSSEIPEQSETSGNVQQSMLDSEQQRLRREGTTTTDTEENEEKKKSWIREHRKSALLIFAAIALGITILIIVSLVVIMGETPTTPKKLPKVNNTGQSKMTAMSTTNSTAESLVGGTRTTAFSFSPTIGKKTKIHTIPPSATTFSLAISQSIPSKTHTFATTPEVSTPCTTTSATTTRGHT